MDVYESEFSRKNSAVVTARSPLVAAEKNNAITTRRSQTREVSSRYKSPAPSTPSGPRRFPSPNTSKTVSATPPSVQKRAQSAERKRPSTPPSPPRPSTPVHDLSLDTSRKTSNGRPESLWPSTMRSLSVSFQSDAISLPVSKKEKPVTTAPLDRTLRPSSNVTRKPAETPLAPRKPTPERKRSPVKGKILPDQSENSKPVDGLHSRLLDLHRWPNRIGGKVSSNSLSRSVDLTDKAVRSLSASLPGNGVSSSRKAKSDSIGKLLPKSISCSLRKPPPSESVKVGVEVNAIDGSFLPVLGNPKLVSTPPLDRAVTSPVVRSQNLPLPGSRPPSPSKTSVIPASVSRGVSPSRSRPSTPPRGISPSRIRSSASCQSNNTTSVLTFIADVKKGKKVANHIDDAHHLRLLYNRYLQWRFANAQAQSVLHIQEATAERALYNVCNSTLNLWDSVSRKRISFQQLKLEIKLKSVLNNQLACLEEWGVLEKDLAASLSGAVEDLEASTLRIPVSGGARADIETLKGAICSAVDVMQAMGSSICSLLSRAEEMNILVSELSVVAAKEKTVLTKCEGVLASMTVMQVEDYSLRTHLIQMKQAMEKQTSLLGI